MDQGNVSFDEEVYDDRQFYSMLLKSFISSSSAGAGHGLRSNDLEALRQYKRSKQHVSLPLCVYRYINE